jgi:hypothetical protein
MQQIAFPLIQRAAMLASVQLPQPVCIFGLPLPGEPFHITVSLAILCAARSTALFHSTRSASPLKACRIRPFRACAVQARTCVRVSAPTIPV